MNGIIQRNSKDFFTLLLGESNESNADEKKNKNSFSPYKDNKDKEKISDNDKVPLSPKAQKEKIDEMIECFELGNKNFPSKREVCKGQTNTFGNILFNNNNNVNFIVNYNENNSPLRNNSEKNTHDIDQQCSNNYNRDSYHSPNSEKFDYSPSDLFNKKISNKSLYKVSGSSNDKITEDDAYIIEDLAPIENEENAEENKEQELYMLSFESEDEYNDKDSIKQDDIIEDSNLNNNNMQIQRAINKSMEKYPKKKNNQNSNKEENKENKNILKEETIDKTNDNKQNNVNINNCYNSYSNNYYIANNNNKVNIINYNNKPVLYQNNFGYNLLRNNMMIMNQYINLNQIKIKTNQEPQIKKKQKKINRLDPSFYTGHSPEELAHKIVILSKDQGGCRFLQKLLEERKEKVLIHLYQPLLDNILQIVNNPFGNYLVQKSITYMNQEQIHKVIFTFAPYLFDIGSNPHGTRVIQHLISFLSSKFLIEYFLSIMTPYIIPLLKDINGTYIVQKFTSEYPYYSTFIHKIIIDNSPNLACDRHGCCVIQKYLETSNGEMLNLLLNKLISNVMILIIDKFGNYVIQTILQMNNPDKANEISLKISSNVSYYAMHKYSSNVVEKCFDYCNGYVKQRLIYSVLSNKVITDLILNEHGNYIIQKVLSCVNVETRKNILHVIVPLFDKLKMLPYGERIINRLLASYSEIKNYSSSNRKQNVYYSHPFA